FAPVGAQFALVASYVVRQRARPDARRVADLLRASRARERYQCCDAERCRPDDADHWTPPVPLVDMDRARSARSLRGDGCAHLVLMNRNVSAATDARTQRAIGHFE